MEGNEPREAGVGEGQALHVEVCAVPAARELQQVRRALWPQDRTVPGGLPAPWEREGGQRCVPVSEEPEPLLRGRGLSFSRDITGWRPRTGAMGVPTSPPSATESPAYVMVRFFSRPLPAFHLLAADPEGSGRQPLSLAPGRARSTG